MILKIIQHINGTPHHTHHIFESDKFIIEELEHSDRNCNLNNIYLGDDGKKAKLVVKFKNDFYEFNFAYLMENGKTVETIK